MNHNAYENYNKRVLNPLYYTEKGAHNILRIVVISDIYIYCSGY